MSRTTTERLISRGRKGQLLVPLIEERLRYPLEIDDDIDVAFITELLRKQYEREHERKTEKKYSPSQLASCLRSVYLNRNYKGPRVKQTRIEPNFYFLTGDWLHVKWQFVFHKMDREGVEGFKLIDCEIPVRSKRQDHGGTLDVMVEINNEPLIVDVKGLNVRAFQKAVMGEVDLQYRIQLADYIILCNSDKTISYPRVDKGIILVENKGGPDNNHPVALTEVLVDPNDHKVEIRWRLEELRKHEKEQTIPEPSCQTINGLQFQGCPFRAFCRNEVKQIQKNAKGSDTDEPKRARRSTRKRTTRAGRN